MKGKKLSRAEQIRLECLAQAVAYQSGRIGSTPSHSIITNARDFENYVKDRHSDGPGRKGE